MYCFAFLRTRSCQEMSSPQWTHLSSLEHCCSNCFSHFSLSNSIIANRFRTWSQTWKQTASHGKPTLSLHLSDEHLPYYVQCMTCSKWRRLPRQFQLTPKNLLQFECQEKTKVGTIHLCNMLHSSKKLRYFNIFCSVFSLG